MDGSQRFPQVILPDDRVLQQCMQHKDHQDRRLRQELSSLQVFVCDIVYK